MYNHEPEDYDCPFCKLAAGRIDQDCVILDDGTVFAVLALHQTEANFGNTLVMPKAHIENLYDFPAHLGEPLMRTTRAIAYALKELTRCDGVSIRQHNEPAGSQDVWHFHMHVTPRYKDDQFYKPLRGGAVIAQATRAAFAAKLAPLAKGHLSQ
jgi:histidine triad (HIT) family protein